MDRPSSKSIERVTGGAVSVTIAVIISRVLGLVREQILAYFFGAGKAMDAFVVAYRIPNLLRDLFAEGALGSAFAKVISAKLQRESSQKVLNDSSLLISNWVSIVGIFVLLGLVFASELVGLIAPAFKETPDKFALTVDLTRIMMPFLLFISLSAIFAGILNSLGYFFIPALSSAFFNLSSITIGALGYFLMRSLGYEPIYAMAIGVTTGGLLQALFQYPWLKTRGFQFQFRINFSQAEFQETLKLIFPVVVGLSAVQLNVFVNTFFATSCGEGAISWYNYAFRVMYVPLGLFGVGLAQALLPELTKQTSTGNLLSARETLERSLIISLSLSIPSAIGLFFLSKEIVTLLFERGNFLREDTIETSRILSVLALSLPFYSLSKSVIPLFYALGKTYIPTFVSFFSVLTNIVVILLTIDKLGILGVASGTVASLVGQALFLLSAGFYFLRGLNWRYLFSALFALTFSSTALILSLLLIKSVVVEPIFRVLLSILLGAIIYITACKISRIRDTYIFYENLFSRLKKILIRNQSPV